MYKLWQNSKNVAKQHACLPVKTCYCCLCNLLTYRNTNCNFSFLTWLSRSKRKRKWTILEVIQECVDFPLESSALVLGHSIPSLPPPTQAELEVVPQNENEVTIEEDI